MRQRYAIACAKSSTSADQEKHPEHVHRNFRDDPADLERDIDDIPGLSIGVAQFGSGDHVDARGQNCIRVAAKGEPASLMWMADPLRIERDLALAPIRAS